MFADISTGTFLVTGEISRHIGKMDRSAGLSTATCPSITSYITATLSTSLTSRSPRGIFPRTFRGIERISRNFKASRIRNQRECGMAELAVVAVNIRALRLLESATNY